MELIGLLDCNNFFVSCERLFRPDLQTKPVAVLSSNDGCIVARSQEVKAMGIPMGIPLFQAKQLVDMSEVTLFSSNFTLYRDLSARVMRVLADEVGEIDVYSIDEAFFTVTGATGHDLASLRARIIQKTGIPISIGVSKTKTLAKEASKFAKQSDGVCLLTEAEWQRRSGQVSCSDVWGLGRASVKRLGELGIKTAGEFMALDRSVVRELFGIAGERIYDELHGIPVYSFNKSGSEVQKSITSSRSFAAVTHSRAELDSAIAYHVANVAKKLRARQVAATLMYIELRASRHGDFAHRQGSQEVILPVPTNSTSELTKLALQAVKEMYDATVPYKKAGVTVGALLPEDYQIKSLFDHPEKKTSGVLDDVLDKVQKRFGFKAVYSGAILPSRDRSSVRLRSQAYTTAWKDIPTVRA